MSTLVRWLDVRVPAAPEDLVEGLRVQEMDSRSAPTVVAALMREAMSRLRRARARLGRVRKSAFHLLAADALLTYACEAALEVDDAEETLLRLMRTSSAP